MTARRKTRWRLPWGPPRHLWQAGLIMAAVSVVLAVAVGITGYSRSPFSLDRPRETLSFQTSLVIGIVTGSVVFLLYVTGHWPYRDFWGRTPKQRR